MKYDDYNIFLRFLSRLEGYAPTTGIKRAARSLFVLVTRWLYNKKT